MGRKKNVVIDDDEYSIGTELSEESQLKEEKVAPSGGKKKGKKGNSRGAQPKDLEDEDDDAVAGEEDEAPEIVFAGKKKKAKAKKGGASAFGKSGFELPGDEDNDKDEDAERENDAPVVSFTGKKKSSKGMKKGGNVGFGLLEDEDSDKDGDMEDEDEVVPPVSITGNKPSKGSKNGGAGGVSKASFELLEDEDNEIGEDVRSEDDAPALSSSGKNKSAKGKRNGASAFSSSTFDALGDDEGDKADSTLIEERSEDGNKSENDDGGAEPIPFSGKKKKSKSGKKSSGSVFASSSFDALDEGVDPTDEKKDEDDDNDVETTTFSGKKKKSSKSTKKGGSLFSSALLNEEEEPDSVHDSQPLSRSEKEEDDPMIAFSGKKKSSKKKNSSTFAALADEVDEAGPKYSSASGEVEMEEPKGQKGDVTKETSKNKKKKKKSGRTEQEEDELDKILAELGGPSISKPATVTAAIPQEDKAEIQPESVTVDEAVAEKEGEAEGVLESAAAKKKKKKKEKEKEKKAAAAAVAEEKEKLEVKKTKADDKKVSKKVREMQEALARRKEAEERKKEEEEEKLRREEEERRRQEELERQAEEARRKKKEKEKEKLLKKKQEGKLLTGRQKEEQRRLEAMRNQFLSNKGIALPAADGGAPAKRPIYSTKKSKAQHTPGNGASTAKTETAEDENIKQHNASNVEPTAVGKMAEAVEVDEAKELKEGKDKVEAPAEIEENGGQEEEDDEEWDAKSWDNAELALPGKSAYEDEEVDAEPAPVVKKDVKKGVGEASPPAAPARKEVRSPADKEVQPRAVETKQNHPDVAAAEVKKEASTSGLHSKQSEGSLRSPICCIMGHVDTGKTKLLDCIRGTNVQEGEAGGITQQIGATYFPAENIRERTKDLKADAKLNVPGLLVIDTPGHESFTNLRSRGSGLCDIAILVVDIMHGLEPQTIESLNLLKMRDTEFIVALNKVDRLYGWKTCRNAPIIKAMKLQSKDVQTEFNHRLVQIITQFKEQGLNTELYYKNKEMGETYSIIPTSAISGEGIPDMLLLLVQWTQKTMVEKLTYTNEVQCTVLEVKVVEGHGTTIDVILVNGVLREGDEIVVCGMQGPIVTTIRALLTPHPMKELRVKGSYLHHKEIKAAQGIKISAQGLEHAIAGTSLHVVGPDDDVEDIKASAMQDMKSVMSRIDKSGEGVYVQASTLGSLEALLEFLKTPEVNIPVSGIGIGPVHKKDVMKASVMLEKKKEYATILAFDVKVTPEAREYADEAGVKVFIADIIYHLFDQFRAYIQNLKEEQKKEAAEEAVFPCVLKILPNCVFNKKDPIVLGVDIIEGIAKIGTPICIPSREFTCIGKIASIENNHKPVDIAKRGQKVAIKIVGSNAEEQQKMFGRHFEMDDELVSQISRKSIDILKANYKEDLSMDDWRLVIKLKNLFKIQ